MWQKDAHVQVMQSAWPGVFDDEIARERADDECRAHGPSQVKDPATMMIG